jgi:uncharacterized protein involved in tellurium resistance
MSSEDLDFSLLERGASNHMMLSSLKVTLSWSAPVDLDLMAFYRTKSGDAGGVYSSMYSEGGQGDLNAFPFMKLDADAGVGATGGDQQETLQIKHLNDMSELYLVAVNFTDAAQERASAFADFDGRVVIENEKGQRATVVLASTDTGAAAVFAHIEHSNSLIGPVLSLKNESRVMSFAQLRADIPGARDLSLANKLLLQGKGDSAPFDASVSEVKATLRWKASVDLDLHCFYTTKGQSKPSSGGGFFSRLFGGEEAVETSEGTSGHIYFRSRGTLNKSPFILLDQDAGIGDRGGDNEENIHFGDITHIEQAIIVANIFNKPNARFGDYDGSVILKAGAQEIEVPLTEREPGAWCIIAQIDNRTGVPTIVNINQTQSSKPESASV